LSRTAFMGILRKESEKNSTRRWQPSNRDQNGPHSLTMREARFYHSAGDARWTVDA
jgi:hypothetical protein